MILSEFEKYKNENTGQQFEDFCFRYLSRFSRQQEINRDLLKQIFELQVCVEGMLQDRDEELPRDDKTMVNK